MCDRCLPCPVPCIKQYFSVLSSSWWSKCVFRSPQAHWTNVHYHLYARGSDTFIFYESSAVLLQLKTILAYPFNLGQNRAGMPLCVWFEWTLLVMYQNRQTVQSRQLSTKTCWSGKPGVPFCQGRYATVSSGRENSDMGLGKSEKGGKWCGGLGATPPEAEGFFCMSSQKTAFWSMKIRYLQVSKLYV